MNNMRKFLSVMLCVVMLFSLFGISMTVYADETAEESGMCGENASYVLDNMSHELTISGEGKIDDYFFKNRTDIESVSISSRITEIGKYSFGGCSNIKTVYIAGTMLQRIGDYAFYGCSSISDINIPLTVSYIGSYAFACCFSLEEISLPAFLPRVEEYCFNSCTNLKKVTFGFMVKSIGKYAFGFCTSLTDINLPQSMDSFDSSSFYNCKSLKSFRIPDLNNTEYEYSYLAHCNSLEEIEVSEDNPYFSVDDGVLYNKDKTVLLKYPAGKSESSFSVPETVKEIHPFAFSYSGLSEIKLPEGVEKIGDSAFFACHNIADLSLPESLRVLEERAFSECVNLRSMEIPVNVEKISGELFENCLRLESVTISSGVHEIVTEGGVFDTCLSLNRIINLSDDVICEDYCEPEDGYTVFRSITEENPMTLEENILYLERFINLNDKYVYSNVSQDKDSYIFMLSDLYGQNFSSVEEYTTWRENNYNKWYSAQLPESLTIICKEKSAQHTDCIENGVKHSIAYIFKGNCLEDCDIKCSKHLDIYNNDDIEPTCHNIGYKGGKVCLTCGERAEDEQRLAAAVIEPAVPYGELLPHTQTIEPGAEPTCLEMGYEDIIYCEVCGKILSTPVSIPALGHIDENEDGLCDRCYEIIDESDEPETVPFWDKLVQFFANAFSRILAIFKKIFG